MGAEEEKSSAGRGMRLRPGNPSKQIASGLKSLATTPSPLIDTLIDTLRAGIKGGARNYAGYYRSLRKSSSLRFESMRI